MSEQDLQLIERYVAGEMTSDEQASFELRLRTDEPLRNELEAYRMAIYAIRQEKKERLKKDLRGLDAAMDQENKRGSVIRLWWKVASAVAAVLAVFFYFNSTSSEIPDTLPSDVREQVFADHFTPHRDESMNPNVRSGNVDTSHLLRYQLAYWNADYARTLVLYDSLSAAQQANAQIRFIRANVLLKENRMEEAEQILKALQQEPDFVYVEETKWLLALTYIKTGEIKAANEMLHSLQKSGNPEIKGKARSLLRNVIKATR